MLRAAQKGHAGVVELLLARGADPNKARTDDGATPCFRSQNGHAAARARATRTRRGGAAARARSRPEQGEDG